MYHTPNKYCVATILEEKVRVASIVCGSRGLLNKEDQGVGRTQMRSVTLELRVELMKRFLEEVGG